MSEFERDSVFSQSHDGLQDFMMEVFTRMGVALIVTAVTAYLCYQSLISGGLMYSLLVNHYYLFFWGTMLAQFGICIGLSAGLNRMKPSTASTLFYVYAVVTGITFSILPLIFEVGTIFTAFLFAAAMYICCLIIGKNTKTDMTRFTGLLMGALFALILAGLFSAFIPFFAGTFGVSVLGIIVFLALTAYDTQMIKRYYYRSEGFDTLQGNLSVYCAFNLYLDFINVFLYVLQLLGSRRRD